MKKFILFTAIATTTVIALQFAVTEAEAGDYRSVTSYTRPYGRGGYITNRSDGSTTITQLYGRGGYLSRDTGISSGRRATHITQKFGRGYITRSTGDFQ